MVSQPETESDLIAATGAEWSVLIYGRGVGQIMYNFDLAQVFH